MTDTARCRLSLPWVVAAVAMTLVAVGPLRAQDAEAGKVVYDRWCAGCHGDEGAGDGPAAAYMLPPPRDFTRAVYQIRRTASGELPTDDDLRRVIEVGMPGSTMPAWRPRLSRQQITDVIAYLKTFSRFFDGTAPTTVAVNGMPRVTEEGLAEGRQLYVEELECLRCHGDVGRGEGNSAPTLTDDWDFPIRAANLTKNWMFNGGGTVEDIYMRMRTGLDGTPMPSFSDVIDAEIITEDQLWRVAQYVRSLAPEDPPVRRDVVRAVMTEEALPSGPSDARWEDVEAYYIPMVGQITIQPRWFAPTVDALFVRAMHDGQTLALHISWDDPTRSPDPAWDEFFEGVKRTLAAPDGPLPETQGPDILTVQFPARPPAGTVLPYFLGGDARNPTYAWKWTSEPDGLAEGTATGLGTFAPFSSSQATHEATFADGQWRLQITRAMVPADSVQAPSFPAGQPIGIAFQAADGTDAEDAIRGSVSAWYSIYLDVPTPTSVFLAPVMATLLTFGLGMVIVWRAQKRERGA